jgi:hypothetical protein
MRAVTVHGSSKEKERRRRSAAEFGEETPEVGDKKAARPRQHPCLRKVHKTLMPVNSLIT